MAHMPSLVHGLIYTYIHADHSGPNVFWGFFLRKISPELTFAANHPLFAEEDWPWANICAIFLCFICGTPVIAWFAKQCHVRTGDPNQWTPGAQSGMCTLNRCATGPAPIQFHLKVYLGSCWFNGVKFFFKWLLHISCQIYCQVNYPFLLPL